MSTFLLILIGVLMPLPFLLIQLSHEGKAFKPNWAYYGFMELFTVVSAIIVAALFKQHQGLVEFLAIVGSAFIAKLAKGLIEKNQAGQNTSQTQTVMAMSLGSSPKPGTMAAADQRDFRFVLIFVALLTAGLIACFFFIPNDLSAAVLKCSRILNVIGGVIMASSYVYLVLSVTDKMDNGKAMGLWFASLVVGGLIASGLCYYM